MSASYERMNYITSFGFSIRWRQQFISLLQTEKENPELLDLLTGMGETWNAVKRKFPKAKLTAVDFSEGMLQYAEKKNKSKFNSEIILLKQDLLQNNLADGKYDIIICSFGLKTFNEEQLKLIAKETKRILKPGGEFSFIEVSKPESKILQFLYGFYLGKIIPILGRLLLGNPVEYKMLWEYTNKFGNAKRTAELFKEAGLTVYYKSYFFGCATGFYGRKD